VGKWLTNPKNGECVRNRGLGKKYLQVASDRGFPKAVDRLGRFLIASGHFDEGLEKLGVAHRMGYWPALRRYVETCRAMGALMWTPEDLFLKVMGAHARLKSAVSVHGMLEPGKTGSLEKHLKDCQVYALSPFFGEGHMGYSLRLWGTKEERSKARGWMWVAANAAGLTRAKRMFMRPNWFQKKHAKRFPNCESKNSDLLWDAEFTNTGICSLCKRPGRVPNWVCCSCDFEVCPVCAGGLFSTDAGETDEKNDRFELKDLFS
jgi:hypothetical protein